MIQNGIQIDYEPAWKGRKTDTYIFAGEVNIAGEPHAVGVVVSSELSNGFKRYYLHEVIELENNNDVSETQSSVRHPLERLRTYAENTDTSSEINIPQTHATVNNQTAENNGVDLETLLPGSAAKGNGYLFKLNLWKKSLKRCDSERKAKKNRSDYAPNGFSWCRWRDSNPHVVTNNGF